MGQTCSYDLLACGLFEPYFLRRDGRHARVTSFLSQAAAKAIGGTEGAAGTSAEQDQKSRSNGKLILQLSDICLSPKGRGYLTNNILYLRRKHCSSLDWFTKCEICTLPSLLQDDGFSLSHPCASTLRGCLKNCWPELRGAFGQKQNCLQRLKHWTWVNCHQKLSSSMN